MSWSFPCNGYFIFTMLNWWFSTFSIDPWASFFIGVGLVFVCCWVNRCGLVHRMIFISLLGVFYSDCFIFKVPVFSSLYLWGLVRLGWLFACTLFFSWFFIITVYWAVSFTISSLKVISWVESCVQVWFYWLWLVSGLFCFIQVLVRVIFTSCTTSVIGGVRSIGTRITTFIIWCRWGFVIDLGWSFGIVLFSPWVRRISFVFGWIVCGTSGFLSVSIILWLLFIGRICLGFGAVRVKWGRNGWSMGFSC